MARRPGPERTCVGCRGKASKAALLRVVAAGDRLAPRLVPDPAGRLPGRGASVHPDPRCVDLADRRRAFQRSLRLAGPVDVEPVREHVLHTLSGDGTTPQHGTIPQHGRMPAPPDRRPERTSSMSTR